MAKRNRMGIATSMPNGSAVADFISYPQAVDYVEQLIKGEFPANAIAIIGTNLTTVERVRSKLSYSRIAFNGAILGAWIGLVIYFIFGANGDMKTGQYSLTSALIVGAGVGMLWQVVRFSLMRNKRAFESSSQVVASKYEVLVPSELVGEAQSAYLKGGTTEN